MTPVVQYDPRWRLSEAARSLPCMKAPRMWEKEAGKEANAIARKACVLACQFRVDCYMTSYWTGDSGVIRGGIMLIGRVKMRPCVRCGLPAIRVSRRRVRNLCAACVCLWDCAGCGQRFWVERQQEPRSPRRQYHSESCRVSSITDRIMAMRTTTLAAA